MSMTSMKINWQIIARRDLSNGSKLVFTLINNCDPVCAMSCGQIADKLGMGDRSVFRDLQLLRRHGLIRAWKSRGHATIYQVI